MEKAVLFKLAKTETMHTLPSRDLLPVEKNRRKIAQNCYFD